MAPENEGKPTQKQGEDYVQANERRPLNEEGQLIRKREDSIQIRHQEIRAKDTVKPPKKDD